MTQDRVNEALKLMELIQQEDGKRGALKRASRNVYPGVTLDLAYDRARQTLKDYRHFKKTGTVRRASK